MLPSEEITPETDKKVGIIAGKGALPERLAARLLEKGAKPVLCRIGEDAGVGEAGKIIRYFKTRDVKTLVLVGGLQRPNLLTLRADRDGARIIAKLVCKTLFGGGLGDDALLKIVRAELEKNGFRIAGIHHFMPELLCPKGALGHLSPPDAHMNAIERGVSAAKELGRADVGQAVIVDAASGEILAREGKRGTDSLLRSVKTISGDKILVKVSKPEQDYDLDLPTIGPITIRLAAESGVRGIVLEAEKTLIAERGDVENLMYAYNMYVLGV